MAESQYKPGLLKYVFDPFEIAGVKIKSKATRAQVLDEVADFVKTKVLEHVGEADSPVSGYGKFAALSQGYSVKKKGMSSSAIANLELEGDMLNALSVNPAGTSQLALTIKGEQAEKADGHCKLTGRVNQTLKKRRRFIPAEDEAFKRDILDGIKRIVRGAAADEREPARAPRLAREFQDTAVDEDEEG